jgi:hypothetical protein
MARDFLFIFIEIEIILAGGLEIILARIELLIHFFLCQNTTIHFFLYGNTKKWGDEGNLILSKPKV